MKGAIAPDHIGDNNYQFLVAGLLPLTAVEISGIDEELKTADLPDRTRASGGTRDPVEFDLMVPAHHDLEIAAMEVWYKEAQDPAVLPTYKKPCTLVMPRISGTGGRTYTLVGVFVKGRGIPSMKMDGDGSMQVITYKMSADDVIPF